MIMIMTVMMMMMTSLTQRDLGEGQDDGDHDDTRGDRAQYQEILTGMGGMPPPSSPILSLLGPLSTLLTLLSSPASGRHPPAGAGATGQGQCFGHYRSQLSLFCRYNAYSDTSKQWAKWVRKISSIFRVKKYVWHCIDTREFPQVKLHFMNFAQMLSP